MNSKVPAVTPSRDAAATGRQLVPVRCRPTSAPCSANERLLHGLLLPDVRFLRQRGFGVHMEGDRYRVGNRLMSAGELAAIAARERRLVGGE